MRKTQKLKVVGIIDEEPYGGMRTVSRGRIFLPVDLTEKLNMAQFTDMRSSLRGGGGKTYMTLTVRVKDPGKVAQVQDAINKMGFRTFSVLDATKSLRRFFTVLDLFLGIFGSLALAVATLAIINTLVMAVLERRREIGVMKAIGASDRRCEAPVLRRSRRDGLLRRPARHRAGIRHRQGHQRRNRNLPASASAASGGSVDPAAVADRRRHRVLDRGEPAGGLVSGEPRRQARSGADVEVRVSVSVRRATICH